MFQEDWVFFWAAVDTDSTAYKVGQVIGDLLIAALAITVVVVVVRWIRDR